MTDDLKRAKTFFLLGEVITFGFITLLQFLSGVWFILALVLMHSGIVMFIVARKRFEKQGVNVLRQFRLTYIVLAFYLPVLGYKLLARVFAYAVNETLTTIYVLVLTAIAVMIGVYNTLAIAKVKSD